MIIDLNKNEIKLCVIPIGLVIIWRKSINRNIGYFWGRKFS